MPRSSSGSYTSHSIGRPSSAAASWKADSFMVNRLSRQDHWISPARRTLCHVCHVGFSLLVRKHNCYLCGEVVCSACLETLDIEKPSPGPGPVGFRSSVQQHSWSDLFLTAKLCLDCFQDHVNTAVFPEVAQGVALKGDYVAPDGDFDAGLVMRDAMKFSSTVVIPIKPTIVTPSQPVLIKHPQPPSSTSAQEWKYPWAPPPNIPNDDRRVLAVKSLRILDTPPEDVYDVACTMAARAYMCPISGVSFITRRRQWLKSSIGLSQREIPRKVTFCAHTIASLRPFVVLDAPLDDRFELNPLVTGSSAIRFYAGAPIVDMAGYIVGTVFVMDTKPRLSCDTDGLMALAKAVTEVLAADLQTTKMLQAAMGVLSSRSLSPSVLDTGKSDDVNQFYAMVRESVQDMVGVNGRHWMMPSNDDNGAFSRIEYMLDRLHHSHRSFLSPHA
ncbi:hypothetical protein AC1031_003413 [Aphanomyces cochlioides]|nr:hypothetical protein AC1031_003413 [Aphanomyces cochlioides]